MGHIYNGILATEGKEFESVELRWTNREPVIKSKERKRKTNIIY